MLKGIVSGAEKDIKRIPMKVGNEYKEGWEVRDNQDRLIWGREDDLQTATGTLPLKGYGVPVKVKSLLGNGQQTGTPTHDAPIIPEFVGARTANLFDINATPTKYNQSTIVTVDGQTLTITGAWYIYYEIDVAPNTDYYVKWTIDYSEIEGRGSIAILTTSGQTIHNQSANPYSFNSGENQRIRLLIYSASSTSATVRLSNIMLNLGSTALPYEPYGYKIPLTCAGQTVPVYLGQTQTVRRIKKLVLTGEEDWQMHLENYYISVANYYNLHDIGINLTICSHFENRQESVVPDGYYGLGGIIDKNINTKWNGNIVFNPKPLITTKQDWMNYLAAQYAAGHPVTVWYVLAEPEIGIVNEPLCKIGDYADELNDTVATLPEIPTTTGQNTLTVDTTLAPYEVTIKGHIKHGYWGKIREAVRSGAAQTMFPVGTI